MNSNICTKQQNKRNLHTSKQQRVNFFCKNKKKPIKKPWNSWKHLVEDTKQKEIVHVCVVAIIKQRNLQTYKQKESLKQKQKQWDEQTKGKKKQRIKWEAIENSCELGKITM
jgi:hypothetical protein